MLLEISTTHKPATDLSFLLHKHPDKLQSVELAHGKAHIFYPEASDARCTAALLLDIDPIGLVRNAPDNAPESFSLGQYVNDRPYVASSFLSAAIAKAFSTAMNGTCKNRPQLVDIPMPLEAKIAVLPAPRGGEGLIRRLFEPLGYTVQVSQQSLDTAFAEWGPGKYFTVTLAANITLKALLSHLYVLIPVLDNEKHYWVSRHEVEKLLEKGEGWLKDHPEKEQITRRYLRNITSLTRTALTRLMEEESDEAPEISEDVDIQKETLHTKRLNIVVAELLASGARRVVDLGCGEGKLLKLLLRHKQFEHILGVDVAQRSLAIAMKRLRYDDLAPAQKERITLLQGALTYRDRRLNGYDAAAIVEVIEHLDPDRLHAFERAVFESARPGTVILTTPNREYNEHFESLQAGTFRHADHRFEWTRSEFEAWGNNTALRFGYTVVYKPVGDVADNGGAPSQMAIFTIISRAVKHMEINA